ncbi:MAG: hypothetical protein H6591_03090 [Flavobacteriales bacterium]|nr:hypothetical protein [Flavobacteriales bacterium]
MRAITFPILLFCTVLSAQTLVYDWPGLGEVACTEWIGCDAGCSACNAPQSTGAVLIGASAAWVGVDACPHAKGEGDSQVFTTGWNASASEPMIVISLIALETLTVDSLIIEHQGIEGGSGRMRVRFGINQGLPEQVMKEEALDGSMQRTVVTGLGCMTPAEGGAFGTAQIVLQAFDGGDGWWLDRVRIVTSPCLDTGFASMQITSNPRQRPTVDFLGRRVGPHPAPGFYLNAAGNRVVVVE